MHHWALVIQLCIFKQDEKLTRYHGNDCSDRQDRRGWRHGLDQAGQVQHVLPWAEASPGDHGAQK